ncbi:MAG: hypothetical protein EXS55_03410 [Candidatus Magasanikbacteria bacterium]|nr:hypothetical protein [Candidatus Magasanikbacteria bacterium]
MFLHRALHPQDDRSVVLHQGKFKKTASLSEAVFMITGMTIGAGVLGIPYVVARAGLVIGLLEILFLGIVMLFLNLMVGEVAALSGDNMQLSGLAGKYLGHTAKMVFSITFMFGSYGVLLAYIVGIGDAMAALIGGSAAMWSIIFWSLGSFIVWRGLSTVSIFEKTFGFFVILFIVGLSLYLLPHISTVNLTLGSAGSFFLPLGVILFALDGAPAVAEAHALLPKQPRLFRRAVIIGTLIPMAVYFLFTLAVVGSQGLNADPIATVGLGARYGGFVKILGSLFAIVAMGTAFVGRGTAFKDTLRWDHKLPDWAAELTVFVVPLGLFLAGVTNFVQILSIVGGVFLALEAIIMVGVYVQARRHHTARSNAFRLTHPLWLELCVLTVFTSAAVLSIIKLTI